MAPWTTLTELFERFTHPGAHAGNLREEELRLAAAALLVHATAIDGEVAPEERRKLRALLQTHFGLGDDETRRLIREAEVREHDAVDLYRFTSVLCAQLDQEGRKQIIEMLWEIAMADRVVHEFEFEPRLAGGRAAWGLRPRSRAVAEDGRKSAWPGGRELGDDEPQATHLASFALTTSPTLRPSNSNGSPSQRMRGNVTKKERRPKPTPSEVGELVRLLWLPVRIGRLRLSVC